MAGTEGLNGSFAERLQALLNDAPGSVTVGSGLRTQAQQQALWDASDKSGKMVAKPGHSNHERGTAADLRFADDETKAWVHANASRYGLFFPMSYEPWHIEPAGVNDDPQAYSVPPDGIPAEDKALGFIDIVLGRRATSSVEDMAATIAGVGQGAITAPDVHGGEGSASNYQDAYRLLVNIGATPEEARVLAAIAGPESGYNPGAHNPDASTGDDSYGLWQINMLGSMGPSRRKQFGIASNDELFDPAVNAKAALAIYRGQGPTAWSAYKNGAYKKYLPGQAPAKVA